MKEEGSKGTKVPSGRRGEKCRSYGAWGCVEEARVAIDMALRWSLEEESPGEFEDDRPSARKNASNGPSRVSPVN